MSPFHPDGSTGHYTQLAWADTKEIGCGFVQFPYKKHFWSSTTYKEVLICNYGPAGNVDDPYGNVSMYKIGRAGSACPTGSYNVDGLCRWTRHRKDSRTRPFDSRDSWEEDEVDRQEADDDVAVEEEEEMPETG